MKFFPAKALIRIAQLAFSALILQACGGGSDAPAANPGVPETTPDNPSVPVDNTPETGNESASFVDQMETQFILAEGEAWAFQLEARDADGDSITYALEGDLSGIPEQLKLDPSTGLLTWTPSFTQAGRYEVTVSCQDGQQQQPDTVVLHLDVAETNRGAVFKHESALNLVATELSPFQFQLDANDPDGDTFEFAVTGAPEGLSVDDTGLITWQPSATQSGVFSFQLLLSDNIQAQPTVLAATIRVANKNLPPAFSEQNVLFHSINENTVFELGLLANDFDNDRLTFAALGALPEGMVLNAQTGVVTWQPSYTASGQYDLAFSVSDGQLLAETNLAVTITVLDVNAPVQFSADNMNVVPGKENESLTVPIQANDVDGDTIAYLLMNAPSGMSIDQASGVISWQPTFSQSGNFDVTVAASDSKQTRASLFKMEFQIDNVNRAARFELTQDTITAKERGLLSYTLKAKDDDGNRIRFGHLGELPTGMTLGTTSGFVRWTPSYDQAGEYTIEFTASDQIQEEAATMKLTVTVDNVNRKAVFSTENKRFYTIDENERINFTLLAGDPDEDTITFGFSEASEYENFSFDENTGAFSWTPDYQGAGLQRFNFTVSDADTIEPSSMLVLIRVNNKNLPAEFDDTVKSLVNGEENALLQFNLTAKDEEVDTSFVYGVMDAPDGLNLDPDSGEVTWLPDFDDAGEYLVNFYVSDRIQIFPTSKIIKIVVADRDSPAEFYGQVSHSIVQEETLTFNYQASDFENDAMSYGVKGELPAGMSIDFTEQKITWTPSTEQLGPFTFVLTATDNKQTQVTEQEFRVLVSEPILPATFANLESRYTADAGTLFSITVETENPGPFGAFIDLLEGPEGMTLVEDESGMSAQIEWQIDSAAIGANRVKLSVSNLFQEEDTLAEFSIIVKPEQTNSLIGGQVESLLASLTSSITEVLHVDNYSYMIDKSHRLLVVDNSDPKQLRLVNTVLEELFKQHEWNNLKYDNDLLIAYQHKRFNLSNAKHSIGLIDISDRENPILLSTYDEVDGLPLDVTVNGDTLWVSNLRCVLEKLDISDRSAPALLQTVSILEDLESACYIAAKDDHLFVSASNRVVGYNLLALDVSGDLMELTDVVGRIKTEATGRIYIDGDAAYIRGLNLEKVDISNPAALRSMVFVLPFSEIWGLSDQHNDFQFTDNRVFVSGFKQLQVFDKELALLDTYVLPSRSIALSLTEDHLMVYSERDHVVLERNEPTESRLVVTEGILADLANNKNHQCTPFNGQFACVFYNEDTKSRYLAYFDFEQPLSVAGASITDIGEWGVVSELVAVDGRLALNTATDIKIVNEQFALEQELAVTGCLSLIPVKDSLLCYSSDMQLIPLSDPNAVTNLGQNYTLPALMGDRLYLMDRYQISSFDVSDVLNPQTLPPLDIQAISPLLDDTANFYMTSLAALDDEHLALTYTEFADSNQYHIAVIKPDDLGNLQVIGTNQSSILGVSASTLFDAHYPSVSGSTVIVKNRYDNKIWIFDYQDLTAPKQVESLNIPTPNSVLLSEEHLIIDSLSYDFIVLPLKASDWE